MTVVVYKYHIMINLEFLEVFLVIAGFIIGLGAVTVNENISDERVCMQGV